MNLVIIFGASGYIGSKILQTGFTGANVVGLSRSSRNTDKILQYQSSKAEGVIKKANKITVVNCIQHLPDSAEQHINLSLEGNFLFPKRQILWIEKIAGRKVRIVQMSSYWENQILNRGAEKNSYVLSKKSFSKWMRTHNRDYLEIVIGDVIGPNDTRTKLTKVALERFPEAPENFLENPEGKLQITKIETVLTFLEAKLFLRSGRFQINADWHVSVREFVELVYATLQSKGAKYGKNESLKNYLSSIISRERLSDNLPSEPR